MWMLSLACGDRAFWELSGECRAIWGSGYRTPPGPYADEGFWLQHLIHFVVDFGTNFHLILRWSESIRRADYNCSRLAGMAVRTIRRFFVARTLESLADRLGCGLLSMEHQYWSPLLPPHILPTGPSKDPAKLI